MGVVVTIVVVFVAFLPMAVPTGKTCGGSYEIQQGPISFASPSYGTANYPVNIVCDWWFVSADGKPLTLSFTAMDVEFHPTCYFDYVVVYPGNCGATNPDRHCGTSLPDPVTSDSGILCVRFRSDVVMTRKGFNATVQIVDSSETKSSPPTTKSWLSLSLSTSSSPSSSMNEVLSPKLSSSTTDTSVSVSDEASKQLTPTPTSPSPSTTSSVVSASSDVVDVSTQSTDFSSSPSTTSSVMSQDVDSSEVMDSRYTSTVLDNSFVSQTGTIIESSYRPSSTSEPLTLSSVLTSSSSSSSSTTQPSLSVTSGSFSSSSLSSMLFPSSSSTTQPSSSGTSGSFSSSSTLTNLFNPASFSLSSKTLVMQSTSPPASSFSSLLSSSSLIDSATPPAQKTPESSKSTTSAKVATSTVSVTSSTSAIVSETPSASTRSVAGKRTTTQIPTTETETEISTSTTTKRTDSPPLATATTTSGITTSETTISITPTTKTATLSPSSSSSAATAIPKGMTTAKETTINIFPTTMKTTYSPPSTTTNGINATKETTNISAKTTKTATSSTSSPAITNTTISPTTLTTMKTTTAATTFTSSASSTTSLTYGTTQSSTVLPTAPCTADGYVITTSHILMSPNFQEGQAYPSNAHCMWRIIVPEGSKAVLTFTSMDIEYNTQCTYDAVKIFQQGNSEDAQLSPSPDYTFCGNQIPQPVSLTADAMVEFVSDHIVSRPGFSATVVVTNSLDTTTASQTTEPEAVEVEMCQNETTHLNGRLYVISPGYQNGQYPINVQCGLTVRASTGMRLHVQVLDLAVEFHRSCNWDRLTVYDRYASPQNVLMTCCGIVAPNDVTSDTSSVVLEFVSDVIIPDRGFRLLVSVVDPSEEVSDIPPSSSQPLSSTSAIRSPAPTPGTTTTAVQNLSSWTSVLSELSSATSSSLSKKMTSASPLLSPQQPVSSSSSSLQTDTESHVTLTSSFPTSSPSSSSSSSPSASDAHEASPAIPNTSVKMSPLTSVLLPALLTTLSAQSSLPQSSSLPILPSDTSNTTSTSSSSTRQPTTSGYNAVPSSLAPLPPSTERSDPELTSKGDVFPQTSTTSLSPSSYSGRTTPASSLMIVSSASSLASSGSTRLTSRTENLWTDVGSSTLPEATSAASTNLEGHSEITDSNVVPLSSTTLSMTSSTLSSSTSQTTTTKATSTVTVPDSSSSQTSLKTSVPSMTTSTSPVVASSVPIDSGNTMVDACSGAPAILSGPTGEITSPGLKSGQNYPNNLHCQWIIEVPPEMMVQLIFTAFDVENHPSCSYDKLMIWENEVDQGTLLNTLCGSSLPEPITSYENLVLDFRSDRIARKAGFRAEFELTYSGVRTSDPCPEGRSPCEGGLCIPHQWFCDGEQDCPQADDEDPHVCDTCPEQYFQCLDDSCLPQSYVCDGVAHCSDREDEELCVRVSETGLLQVQRQGQWLPVCHDTWIPELADGACAAAGLGAMMQTDSIEMTSEDYAIWTGEDADMYLQAMGAANTRSSCQSNKVVTISCRDRECGIMSSTLPQPYVLGSRQSVDGQWPWMVAVMTGPEFRCGGSLVADQWVVTAGHCIYNLVHIPERLTVIYGHVNLDVTTNQETRVTEIIMHPENDFIYNADIALLRLQHPLDISTNVRPICLPKRDHQWSSNLPCYVSGWGITDIADMYGGEVSSLLHHAKIKLWEQEKCQEVYTSRLKPTMICAGYEHGEVDACKGDSGGPLVCQTVDGAWTQVGVVSWGEGCGAKGKPGVYTRVDSFLGWIQDLAATDDAMVSCDFETPFICGYTSSVNASSSFLWSRRRGGQAIPARPVYDHTYNNVSGHYMYTHIAYENRRQETTLFSPRLHVQTIACVTFYVIFFGNTDATLRVEAIGSSANQTQQMLHLKDGNSFWSKIEVELPDWVEQVTFITIANVRTDGGIGVDDVSLVEGHCADVAKLSCSFNDGTLCQYHQSSDDNSDWQFKSSKESDQDLGLFLEADLRESSYGDTVQLISPEMTTSVTRCLHFRYKLNQASSVKLYVCTLSIVSGQQFMDCSRWARSSSSNNDWTEGYATLQQSAYPFSVVFRAKSGFRGGIVSIDDIVKVDGACS